VLALDAIAKASPVTVLGAHIVTPGKIVLLFTGEVAAVEAALAAGREAAQPHLLDQLFIKNLHRRVIPAIRGQATVDAWDALGMIECYSVTCGIEVADIAAKEAEVALPAVRLEGGMGGKSATAIMGALEDVQASVRAAAGHAERKGLLCEQVILPRPHPDIRPFLEQVRGGGRLWR